MKQRNQETVKNPLLYPNQKMTVTWPRVVVAAVERRGWLGFTVESVMTRFDGGMDVDSEAKMLTSRNWA